MSSSSSSFLLASSPFSVSFIFFIVSLLLCPSEGLIPLTNGQIYTSLLFSGESIVFLYNLTKPCSEITVYETGLGNLYVSYLQTMPTVFSDCYYTFKCSIDIVLIDHNDPYHLYNQLYISTYLDPLVYDTFTNMTVQVTETPGIFHIFFA